jgi:hypothetical protein
MADPFIRPLADNARILIELEGRPPIVYPDNREIVAAPRGGALAFFEHLLTRRRELKHDAPAVPLPADYQVEIRDRQALAVA